MRITYLHQYFNTPGMVGGTRSYEMARRLVANGHEVNMITSDQRSKATAGWNITEEAGIRVHWLGVPYSNSMGHPARIRAFARFALGAASRGAAIPADVIFATSTPLTVAVPAAWIARRQGAPMVFEVRDLWPEIPIAIGAIRNPVACALARRLERFAYGSASRIVALSPGMKQGIIRTGYPEAHVAVIPNSADLDLFAVPPQEAERFRATHIPGIGDRPLVVYAGTVGLLNGIAYLVELAKVAKSRNHDICFLVVGAGREESAIRRKAQEAGVLGSNFLMLPAVPKESVPGLLGTATIATSLFINIPEMEHNSANKFFDALAAGKPVAINYGGWQADLIRSQEIGVVLPREPEEAFELLAHYATDDEWVAAAGQRARKLAEAHFSRDRLAAQLEAVLVGAINTVE